MLTCMYVFNVCMYVCHVCMCVCMHVYMYACMRVCMRVCMHVCIKDRARSPDVLIASRRLFANLYRLPSIAVYLRPGAIYIYI